MDDKKFETQEASVCQNAGSIRLDHDLTCTYRFLTQKNRNHEKDFLQHMLPAMSKKAWSKKDKLFYIKNIASTVLTVPECFHLQEAAAYSNVALTSNLNAISSTGQRWQCKIHPLVFVLPAVYVTPAKEFLATLQLFHKVYSGYADQQKVEITYLASMMWLFCNNGSSFDEALIQALSMTKLALYDLVDHKEVTHLETDVRNVQGDGPFHNEQLAAILVMYNLTQNRPAQLEDMLEKGEIILSDYEQLAINLLYDCNNIQ